MSEIRQDSSPTGKRDIIRVVELSSLFVIARNSSFSRSRVAAGHGKVRSRERRPYVIEGSMRRAGSASASRRRLVEAETGPIMSGPYR